MKSLYQDLLEAGIQIDHHESDLYFPVTNVSKALLTKHRASATVFKSQKPPNGELWYDVAGAYDPFWEKKGAA